MTDKQKRFCEEYLIDLNATKAAIRAGYAEKAAYSQGQRLLKNVEVAELITKLKANQSERTGITADRVLTELSKLGFADMAEVESFRAADKLRALELIGKHIGMFKSDSDADTPALEKLDKILAEVKSDADREAKAVHRRGK